MRVIHFAIPSPKYFAPLSLIPLQLRIRLREVRVSHFAIPSPKYFAPFSPISFQALFKWMESIKSLGIYCSFSISSCRFYVCIEILSIESCCFWIFICIFSENGAKYIGEGIAKCVTLTSLNLNLKDYCVGENGAKYLGEQIAKCITLTSLELVLS